MQLLQMKFRWRKPGCPDLRRRCGRAEEQPGRRAKMKPQAPCVAGILMATELLGKSKNELREFCAGLDEPAYRGGQLYHALYRERKFDVAQITNLPAALRERLAREARITLPLVKQRFASMDGSVRYLFSLGIGEPRKEEFTVESAEKAGSEVASRANPIAASLEAVFMPSPGRQTICVSTQAGCAVDCRFCLTAQLGLIRNLTAGEILAQVLLPLEEHKTELAPPFASAPGKQTNVVLMGQGEPLLNFDNVMAALRILLDAEGVGISPK